MRLRGISIHEYLDPGLSTGNRLHKEVRLLFCQWTWNSMILWLEMQSSLLFYQTEATDSDSDPNSDPPRHKQLKIWWCFFDVIGFMLFLSLSFPFVKKHIGTLQIRSKLRKFALLSKSVKWDSIHIFNFLYVISFFFSILVIDF